MNEEILEHLIHLSCKYKNSTIKNPPGIRFGKNDIEDDHLPYVSVSGTIFDEPDMYYECLDYEGKTNGKERAELFSNYINGILTKPNRELAEKENIQPKITEEEKTLVESFQKINPTLHDHRIKQIFLPFNNDYLSITPLESAGFSGVIKSVSSKLNDELTIKRKIELESKDKLNVEEKRELKTIEKGKYKDYLKIKKCKGIQVGGGNPQNVSVKATFCLLQQNILYFKSFKKDVLSSELIRLKYRDIFVDIDKKYKKKIEQFLDKNEKIPAWKEAILKSMLEKLLIPFKTKLAETVNKIEDIEDDNFTPFNKQVFNFSNLHESDKKIISEKIFSKIRFEQLTSVHKNTVIKMIGELL